MEPEGDFDKHRMYFTTLELLHHDCSCGQGHVVGGVLLWVGWGDDGHHVVPV